MKHKSLETILKNQFNGRQLEYREYLLLNISVYSQKNIYKKGNEIPIAHLLSRYTKPEINHEETEEEELVVQSILAMFENAKISLVKSIKVEMIFTMDF